MSDCIKPSHCFRRMKTKQWNNQIGRMFFFGTKNNSIRSFLFNNLRFSLVSLMRIGEKKEHQKKYISKLPNHDSYQWYWITLIYHMIQSHMWFITWCKSLNCIKLCYSNCEPCNRVISITFQINSWNRFHTKIITTKLSIAHMAVINNTEGQCHLVKELCHTFD